MDWRKRRYTPGTPVRVFDLDNNDLGVGTLLTTYDCEDDDNEMPRIRMGNGTVLPGSECWWIPTQETDRP